MNEKGKYIKPIQLFFKHQEIKAILFDEINQFNFENSEFDIYVKSTLNDKIDRKIILYDKEICYRNFIILNEIKKSAIREYKNYMEEKVKKI